MTRVAVLESAGVGVRLDRACVDGSLGEQVVICVCTVLAYGAYRASEVSSVGAARCAPRGKSRLIAPYRTYGFGVQCASARVVTSSCKRTIRIDRFGTQILFSLWHTFARFGSRNTLLLALGSLVVRWLPISISTTTLVSVVKLAATCTMCCRRRAPVGHISVHSRRP